MGLLPPRPCGCAHPVTDACGRVLSLETCPACMVNAHRALRELRSQYSLELSASAADPDPDYHGSTYDQRSEGSSSDCPF